MVATRAGAAGRLMASATCGRGPSTPTGRERVNAAPRQASGRKFERLTEPARTHAGLGPIRGAAAWTPTLAASVATLQAGSNSTQPNDCTTRWPVAQRPVRPAGIEQRRLGIHNDTVANHQMSDSPGSPPRGLADDRGWRRPYHRSRACRGDGAQMSGVLPGIRDALATAPGAPAYSRASRATFGLSEGAALLAGWGQPGRWARGGPR
jgi:hypothetical protein